MSEPMRRPAGGPVFAGRDVVWPPADELLQSAERIRAALGDWPAAATVWRLCLAPPETPLPGDILALSDASDHGSLPQRWLAQGAAVLEATPTGARLRVDTSVYQLDGERSDDWFAAFIAFLDCGFALHDALCLAMAWRNGDEYSAAPWPAELARFPRVAGLPPAPAAFAPCPMQLGLYPVVPSADWIGRLIGVGVKTLQLRVKSAPSDVATTDHARDPGDPDATRSTRSEPERIALEIRAAVAASTLVAGVRLFINDHWQQAIQAGAYGVHLGQEDLATADLQAISAAGLRLGLSTHGYYELLIALHFRPSYIAFGAVFPTTTKAMPTAPQGLARLTQYVRLLHGHVPLVAIGGIDAVRLPAVLATGVGSAAVVRAVTEADDVGAAVAALQQAFQA